MLLSTQALLSDPQGHFRKKLPRKINPTPVENFLSFFFVESSFFGLLPHLLQGGQSLQNDYHSKFRAGDKQV